MRGLTLFFTFIVTAVLCAQEVQSFRQHNMKRWGIPAGNYSGIAHIKGDRYALISDKQDADRFLPKKLLYAFSTGIPCFCYWLVHIH